MTHEIEIMTWDTLKHMGLSFFKVSSLCREYRIYNSGVCSFGIFVMLCAYVHSIQCIGPYQLSFLIICVCVCVEFGTSSKDSWEEESSKIQWFEHIHTRCGFCLCNMHRAANQISHKVVAG